MWHKIDLQIAYKNRNRVQDFISELWVCCFDCYNSMHRNILNTLFKKRFQKTEGFQFYKEPCFSVKSVLKNFCAMESFHTL